MTRVAIVYHFFAHYRKGIIKELLKKSAINFLFAGDDNPKKKNGIKVYDGIPLESFINTPFYKIGSIVIQRGLICLALRKDIDVIIYLGDPHFLMTWVSAFLARLLRKRVLFWTHGWIHDHRNIKDHIRCYFYSIANGLLLYGNHAKKIAIKRGFQQKNLYVIGNSLDYETQIIARSNATIDMINEIRISLFEFPNRPMLLCSCRLQPNKQIQLLLEAMIYLKNTGYMTNLLLIGDGPERQHLEDIAQLNNLSVNFFGECYDENKLSILTKAADLTISPGEIGLTAMQSLVFGTPVISHNDVEKQMPEWEAIVPGITGDYFLRDDSIDLARVIKRWLDTKKSKKEIEVACYDIIEKKYNPKVQRILIENAIKGNPANQFNNYNRDNQ